MANKTKAFDCVEMKRRSQEALLAEYRARQEEFATLEDFLMEKARESEWISAIWKKFAAGNPVPPPQAHRS